MKIYFSKRIEFNLFNYHIGLHFMYHGYKLRLKPFYEGDRDWFLLRIPNIFYLDIRKRKMRKGERTI